MSGDPRLEPNWRGYALQALFAFGGALIIAFVFVPYFSPDTNRVTAFVGSLVFMALTIAAAQTVKRP
jgi:hypothetical protein